MFLILLLYTINGADAQTRVVSECTVSYSLHTDSAGQQNKESMDLLRSSSKTVYIKGNDSRVDLVSTSFLQTIIFDKNEVYLLSNLIELSSNSIEMTSI